MTQRKYQARSSVGRVGVARIQRFLKASDPTGNAHRVRVFNRWRELQRTAGTSDRLSLPGCDLSSADLTGIDLSNCSLHGANLTGARLNDANLSRASLRGATLQEAKLIGSDLSGADLVRSDFSSAFLQNADLSGADLHRSCLVGADLSEAVLVGAILTGALLRGCLMDRATLTGATLTGVDLASAQMIDADFSGATLSRADLSDVTAIRAVLVGVDLYKAILTRADLDDAVISGGAKLVRCDLSGARMKRVDLKDANLAESNLSNTDLESANLSGASLRHARLEETYLSGAVLDCVDWEHARFDSVQLSLSQLSRPIRSEIEFRWGVAEDVYRRLKGNFEEVGKYLDAEEAYVAERKSRARSLAPLWLKKWWPGYWDIDRREGATRVFGILPWCQESHPRDSEGASLARWFLDFIPRYLSRYGTSFGRAVLWIVILVALSTASYSWFGLLYDREECVICSQPVVAGEQGGKVLRTDCYGDRRECPPERDVRACLKFSVATMATVGVESVGLKTDYAEWMAAGEAFLGIALAAQAGFVLGNKLRYS